MLKKVLKLIFFIFMVFLGFKNMLGHYYYLSSNTFVCRETFCLKQGQPIRYYNVKYSESKPIELYYCRKHQTPGRVTISSSSFILEEPGVFSFLMGILLLVVGIIGIGTEFQRTGGLR